MLAAPVHETNGVAIKWAGASANGTVLKEHLPLDEGLDRNRPSPAWAAPASPNRVDTLVSKRKTALSAHVSPENLRKLKTNGNRLLSHL